MKRLLLAALALFLPACAGWEVVRDPDPCPPGMVQVWVNDDGQLAPACALSVDDCTCRGVEL